ncbi:MAG: hypothetical protein ACP6IU_07455 [Candidatus Asgardarchaeia archaeon]
MFSYRQIINAFTSETESQMVKRLIAGILIWYFIDTLLFFVIGITTSDLQALITGVFLVFWLILTSYVSKWSEKSEFVQDHFSVAYLVLVLILAFIEETIVYFNGGGLGGKAVSLIQDILLAVPVFVGIALGLIILNHWMDLFAGEFFVLGAIQGFIVEIITAGNFGLMWFLGGPSLGIYGAMMAAVKKKEISGVATGKHFLLMLTIGTTLCFITAVAGAIFGDTIYSHLVE